MQAASLKAEEEIVDALFEPDLGEKVLKTEKDYTTFGKKIAEILNEGVGPYNIPSFFQHLIHHLDKTRLKSDQCKKIEVSATKMWTDKQKEEKKTDKKKPKQSAKPKLVGSYGKTGYEMNNNPGMVNDLMGGDEQAYGEEDAYGDETAKTGG